MFISQLTVSNFRGFKDETTIDFKEGINVLIGPNNCGKSNIIKALALLFNLNDSKKLDTDDFNKNITVEDLKKSPPKIRISAVIKESEKEDLYSDDLVTISTWLTKLDKPYEARLTYEFYLPEKEHKDYKEKLSTVKTGKIDDCWRELRHHFIKKYTYKIYAGNPEHKAVVDRDSLNKFDYQFLDAIRDVERDLFTGRNTLLREVLDFFMDYDIKSDTTKKPADKTAEIQKKKDDFRIKASTLIQDLQKRMKAGKGQMLRYTEKTGASFGNTKPDFEGDILDSELYSALKLIVEHETGIRLPATHNGLGYNNLIYISLLLAKMQKDASGDYLGGNAKIFPILSIEEPEAHLHPSMQYKFLKFLRDNHQDEVRQVFITTHSPNITAAVGLDEIIVMNSFPDGKISVGYPGKVFGYDQGDKDSKAYVTRFLDVTKSDMLFAKAVIFVEGIAEQLLMSIFAECEGKDLEDAHVAVINIGGRYFDHFLKLFDSKKDNTINKKVVCITDADPQRKEKDGGTYHKCYPFELNSEPDKYEYMNVSNPLLDSFGEDKKHPNIRCFSQDPGKGKTFEYELILSNPSSELLINESLANKDEIRYLMAAYKDGKSVDEMLAVLSDKGDENLRIREGIEGNGLWGDDDKKKHIVAARYLNSVAKGINALETYQKLKEQKDEFTVPDYIKKAVGWICQ